MERIIRPVLNFLYSVFRLIFHFFRYGTVWLLRVLWFTLKMIGLFIFLVVKNIPKALRKIAETCQRVAADHDFPTIIIEYLYYAAYGVAVATILSTWILASFLTVFVVRWIFRI